MSQAPDKVTQAYPSNTDRRSGVEPEKLPFFGGPRLRLLHNLVYWLILAFMILVPELRIFKIDILHGQYFYMGDALSAQDAKITFLIIFLAVNVVIFAQNYLFGRLLCGWFCPVGYFSRLSRDLKKKLMRRRRQHPLVFYPVVLVSSTFFGLISLNWVFVDMRTAFRPEDPFFVHTWIAASVLSVFIYIVIGHVEFGFCRSLCPSGAYFTLLSRSLTIDLKFENPEHCISCDACIRACPTDLNPMNREDPIKKLKSSWDLYPDDYRHTESRCFLCGDCIEACDAVFAADEPEATDA